VGSIAHHNWPKAGLTVLTKGVLAVLSVGGWCLLVPRSCQGASAAVVRDIARESTTLAIETLRTIAADTGAHHAARVSAASALLDRGWGKPIQGVAMLTVAAPRGVREMSDGELMAMIEKKTLAAGG
jgi:hypothetical protein